MVMVNGVRTHYQRMPARTSHSAPAPIVVCVHGIGYDSLASFYLTLAPPLSAAGIEVLTYDLRGHGRSERPPTGYQLENFVDDLGELLNQLGINRPVHLVGNSFGGTIAFSFAARHPDRVASVVSIESEPATEPWAAKMGTTIRNVVEAMSKERNIVWVGEVFGNHYARLTRAAGVIISATSIVDEIATGELLGEKELATILCPVLSIVGSEGFQSDDLSAVEALLPNCRTEVIQGQNHSVLVERHQVVRGMMLDWIAEHEPIAVEDGAA
jgi:pimeloyl-ACP methyl ester carboxylesterase